MKAHIFAGGIVWALGCASATTEPVPTDDPHPMTTESASSDPGPVPSASARASASATTPPPAPAEATPPAHTAKLPAGFVWGPDAPEKATTSVMCGDLKVEHLNDDPANTYEPYVRVTDKAGKKLYEARGRKYDMGRMSLLVEFCGDLTGDGVAELYLNERTAGAHCCYTHYVVSMTSPTKNLMMWEKGDGGFEAAPRKLKEGAHYQIVTSEVFEPPFDGRRGDPVIGGYADMPVVPVVLDFSGGKYAKRTFAFSDALRALRDEGRAACAKNKDCKPDDVNEFILALMIGDWDKQKDTLIKDAELRTALSKRANDTKAKLKKQLGS